MLQFDQIVDSMPRQHLVMALLARPQPQLCRGCKRPLECSPTKTCASIGQHTTMQHATHSSVATFSTATRFIILVGSVIAGFVRPDGICIHHALQQHTIGLPLTNPLLLHEAAAGAHGCTAKHSSAGYATADQSKPSQQPILHPDCHSRKPPKRAPCDYVPPSVGLGLEHNCRNVHAVPVLLL